MYSATVVLSEILPRSKNLFPGRGQTDGYLNRWNHEAVTINKGVRELSNVTRWISLRQHHEFHTIWGKPCSFIFYL